MFSSIASFIFGTSATNSETPNRQQEQQNKQAVDNIATTTSELQYKKSRKKFTPKLYWSSKPTATSFEPHLLRDDKQLRDFQRLKHLHQTSEEESTDLDEDEWFVIDEMQKPTLFVDCVQRQDSDSDSGSDISYSQWIKTAEEYKLKAYNPNCKVTADFLNRIQRPQQKKTYCQRTRRQNKAVKLNLAESDGDSDSDSDTKTVATRAATQTLSNVGKMKSINNYVSELKNASIDIGAKNSMEESWYITPPPCFESVGPVNMATSPFENLLIEHPSMSVYHSIRLAQEPTESFVNLDLNADIAAMYKRLPSDLFLEWLGSAGLEEEIKIEIGKENVPTAVTTIAELPKKTPRTNGVRVGRATAAAAIVEAELKEEQLLRNGQKNIIKKERQQLRKGAIKRANKVREYQGKGKPQRRADMQHCRIISGANNNRKGHC